MKQSQTDTSIFGQLAEQFTLKYGASPRIFRAPGRVNLIGEHTDYNDGFVLPAAIDLYTWIAIAPREDKTLQVFSENLNEATQLDLGNPSPIARGHWSDYVQGVAHVLQRKGIPLRGANVLIHSDVPSGSGLSSSAALEVSVANALLGVSGQTLSQVELAKQCQHAENDFVGARCGIMDQFAACFGRAGHAILLDCRSLEFKALLLPANISMVICNTMVKHEHSGGGYNTRRSECEEGVQTLRRSLPGIKALRDVSMSQLEANQPILPEAIYRRCRHIVSENARVLDAAKALEQGDLTALGKNMAASHLSLRNDFEVSCEELDLMVKIAQRRSGVIGSRMTGGGFGGCTINLVDTGEVGPFQATVASEYQSATGIAPEIYVSSAGEGAKEITSS